MTGRVSLLDGSAELRRGEKRLIAHRRAFGAVLVAVLVPALVLQGCCPPGQGLLGAGGEKAKPRVNPLKIQVQRSQPATYRLKASLKKMTYAYVYAELMTRSLLLTKRRTSKRAWAMKYLKTYSSWAYAAKAAKEFNAVVASLPAADQTIEEPASWRVARAADCHPTVHIVSRGWSAGREDSDLLSLFVLEEALAQGGSSEKMSLPAVKGESGGSVPPRKVGLGEGDEVQLDLTREDQRGLRASVIYDGAPPGQKLQKVARFMGTDAREAQRILERYNTKITRSWNREALFYGVGEGIFRSIELAHDCYFFSAGVAGGAAFKVAEHGLAKAALNYITTAVTGADLVFAVGEAGVAFGVDDGKVGARISAARKWMTPATTLISVGDLAAKGAKDPGNWKTIVNFGAMALSSPANKIVVDDKGDQVAVRAYASLESQAQSMNQADVTPATRAQFNRQLSQQATRELRQVTGRRPCPICGRFDCPKAPRD